MNYHEKLLPNQKFNLKNHAPKTIEDLDVERKIYDIVEAFSTSMNERSVNTEMGEAYMGSPPCELRLIDFLCQMIPIENALEIGTYKGLATMRIARHAKHVWTIENHPEGIADSKQNFHINGFDNITLIEEDSREAIEKLTGSFDFIFVDGDKGNYPFYYEKCMPMLNKGGLIIFDDIFFHGDVFNSFQITDKGKGVRKFLEMSKSFEGFRIIFPVGNGILIMRK